MNHKDLLGSWDSCLFATDFQLQLKSQILNADFQVRQVRRKIEAEQSSYFHYFLLIFII